jgi:Ca2+-binding RTX toxin-like protein
MSAGGWQQRVSTPGDYIITFEGGALIAPVSYMRSIGKDNVKVDVTASAGVNGSIALGIDNWLYVRGTDYPDSITFDILDDDLIVTFNGQVQSFPLQLVLGLQTNTYAGSDFVSVSPFITLPTRLYTGQDNDTVYGGGGNDLIVARLGDDVVFGNGGNDTLMTGQGNDLLGGGPGDDSLFGGQGNDTMYGGQGNDTLNARDEIYVDVVIGGLDNDSAKVDRDLDVIWEVEILLA